MGRGQNGEIASAFRSRNRSRFDSYCDRDELLLVPSILGAWVTEIMLRRSKIFIDQDQEKLPPAP